MSKFLTTKYRLNNNNAHLLDIFNEVYFLKMGIVNPATVNKLLTFKPVKLEDLIYHEYYHQKDFINKLIYFQNLTNKDDSIQLYLSYGLLVWKDKDDKHRFSPICLIPIRLQFFDNQIYCQQTSGIIENFVLIQQLIALNKDFLPLNDRLNSIYTLDRYILSFKRNPEFKVHLDNYLTFGHLEQNQFVLNRQQFSIDKNITNKIDEKFHHKDEYGINLFPLNRSQKNILAQAAAGYNFAIDGILGTGKTLTLVNVAIDAIYRGKRVLYISNSTHTLNTVEELVKEFKSEHLLFNMTKGFYKTYKSPTKLDKEGLDIYNIKKSLAANYQIIEKVEDTIFARIRNNHILDCLNFLASIKDNYRLLDLSATKEIYKHEFEEIYDSLEKIEKYLLRFPSFTKSIWQSIPYDHNIKYPNQVITLIYKMHKHFRNLDQLSKDFTSEFGLKTFESYIKMRELVNTFDTFRVLKYPKIWLENNFEIFLKAKDYYEYFKKQFDDYHTTYNDIKYLYSSEAISYDFSSLITNLLGLYFTINDQRSINRVIDKRLNLLMQINRSNEIISTFDSIISELKKKMNYDFEFNEKVFIDLNNLYLYISQNAYHPNWLKINTLHKLHRLIDEVKAITQEIQDYEISKKEFFSKYPRTSIKDLEKDYQVILKKSQDISLSLREKLIVLKYKDYLLSDVIKDFRQFIAKTVQYESLKNRYLEITDFSYSNDSTIIESLQNLYDLQYNLAYPKHLPVFKKHLQNRVQKTNLFTGYANPLKDFSQAYQFINKYRESLIECGFSIETSFFGSLDEIKNINQYLLNFYSVYDQFLLSTNLQNSKIYFDDLIKLEQLNKKLIALKDEINANPLYIQYYGNLFEYEKTNILKLENGLKNFEKFLHCFSDYSDASKILTEEGKALFTQQLDRVVTNIEGIDELIKLYTKLFTDRISAYYYDAFSEIVKNLERFLASKDDLVLYLNITEQLKVLIKYEVNRLIDKVLDKDKGQNIAINFKYTYYYNLWNEFKEKYPFICETNSIEKALNDISRLEKQIISFNTNKVIQKLNTQYVVQKLKTKKEYPIYNKFLQKASSYKRLVLSNTKLLNHYLNIKQFDLILIDDAHISSANNYYNAITGKQVIIAGSSEQSPLTKGSLISQIPKESVITLTHRYLPIPKNILDNHVNTTSLIPNDYFNNQGIEIYSDDIISFVIKKLTENVNYKFNIFIKSLSLQQKFIVELINLLKENEYQHELIYNIVFYNLNIVSLEYQFIVDADFNVLLIDEYFDEFHISSVKRMISDLFTVKQKVVIIDQNNLLNQDSKNEFFNELKENLQQLEITFNEHILQMNLFDKLKEQFGRYNISLIGSYHDLNVVLLKDDALYGGIIYWDINKINYQTIDQYRRYYEHYKQNNWKVYLIWIVDLVIDFNKTVEKIAKEIGGD